MVELDPHHFELAGVVRRPLDRGPSRPRVFPSLGTGSTPAGEDGLLRKGAANGLFEFVAVQIPSDNDAALVHQEIRGIPIDAEG